MRARIVRSLGALAVAAALLTSRAASGDEPRARDPVAWQDEWRRASVPDYLLVGALAGGSAAVQLAGPRSTEPAWTGRNAFDEGARDLLLGGNHGIRQTAKIASDGVYMAMTVYPTLIEALLLAGIIHRRPDVAWELVVMHLQSTLAATFTTLGTQAFVGRARPLLGPCQGDPSYDIMCGTSQLSRSFIGGHVTLATNSAGLVCVHQAHLRLYGSRVAGIVACASMASLAVGVGLARVVADKHWATDIVAGTAVGIASGVLLPLAMHYGFGRATVATGRLHVVPVVAADRAVVTGTVLF